MKGLNRDLNPGPLAPKARIIPLDHWAVVNRTELNIFIQTGSSTDTKWKRFIWRYGTQYAFIKNRFEKSALLKSRHALSAAIAPRFHNWLFSDEKQDSDDGNSNERIIINVSGLRFETQVGTLNKFQNSLLGDATRRKKYYDMDFEIERRPIEKDSFWVMNIYEHAWVSDQYEDEWCGYCNKIRSYNSIFMDYHKLI